MFSKKITQLKPPQVKTDTINMQGGMDEVTPTLSLPTGIVRDALNFECAILGGYSRIQGYERYDGHSSPSSAVFQLVYIDSFVNIPNVGDTINGITSLATGYVLDTGPDYVVISEVTGAFILAEVIKNGSLVVGNSILPSFSPVASLQAKYTAEAANRQRTYITKVGEKHLTMVSASSTSAALASTAAMNVVGDIQLIAKVNPVSWGAATQIIFEKGLEASTANKQYSLYLSSGKVGISVYDGTTVHSAQSSINVPLIDGAVTWLRATVKLNNGAAGWDANFFYSNNGVVWTKIGATVTTATAITAISAGDGHPLYMGGLVASPSFNGNIYAIQIYNGIAASSPAYSWTAPSTIGLTLSNVSFDVEGNGPARGVFVYNDIVYAFRDDNDSTQEKMYVETSTGWQLVPFFAEVYFTAGNVAPAVGSTITQGAVTATIMAVVLQGGAWAGSAVGKFVIKGLTYTSNFVAGAATAPGSTFTLSGAAQEIVFLAGGTVESDKNNFAGQTSSIKMYCCDGVNRSWEFDGTTIVPIDTGFIPDTPKHLTVHKNYLFVAIASSYGWSGPGLPYDWTAISHAGEVAMGDVITNFVELPGSQATAAMGIWSRENTHILYGTGYSDWNLVPLNTGCGGLHYTVQNMAHTYVMDDRGVIDMQTTLDYGNFDIDTITYRVNNFIEQKRTRVVTSSLNRHKSQYRLFFNDGYALYITNLHGQYAWQTIASGVMPVLFPDPVYCIENAKLSDGSEVSYFGSAAGYVHQLDIGSSFDGAYIDAHLTFGANNISSPRLLKDFQHAMLDANSTSYFELSFGYSLGYSATSILQPNSVTYANNNSTAPQWDSFTWDNFYWDGAGAVPLECDMNGEAETYALSIKSSSDQFYAFNVSAAIIHYLPRRLKR